MQQRGGRVVATFSVFAHGTKQQTGTFDANHTVSMPAGTLTGKLIVIIATSAMTNGTVAAIAGYTRFTPSASRDIHIFGKIGTASESSVTVDWTVNDSSNAWAVAIDSSDGWPAIGSVFVQEDLNSNIGAGTGITHSAYTAHTSGGNCLLAVAFKSQGMTGITVTNVAATSGWDQAGFTTGPVSASGYVTAAQVRQAATTVSESVGSNTRTITTWSGSTNGRSSLVIEFAPAAVATPTIVTVGTMSPGATVAVTYSGYVSVPLTANSTLGGVGITVSGATLSGCNIVVPPESAFLFGGSLAALNFGVNTTLVLANGGETASYTTAQVTAASSDQLALRTSAALADATNYPIDTYNSGVAIATNSTDTVYQYSDPADAFTPYPATNGFTALEPAFTLYTKFWDASAATWSGLTTSPFPPEAAPAAGTLEITSTRIALNPPGTSLPVAVDLTAFGSADWLHAARLTTQTFDSKSGGTMIATPTDIGIPAWARGTGDSAGHTLMSWTDGDPLTTGAGYRNFDRTSVNGAGQRFTISPAGALVKIYFWAGGSTTNTFKVHVSFSDSSATPVEIEHTSETGIYQGYLYEITAHPTGGAATIQLDFTRVSGTAGNINWQAIAVESGTAIAAYSLTSSDTTVTPGQTITATLVGGPFQGAITAAYAVYNAVEVPLEWTITSPSLIDVTIPALSEFVYSGTCEFLPWYANFTIRIVAGEESADSPATNQIVAPNPGDYGTVTAPPWGYPPSDAEEGDKAYGEVVTGAGTLTPETFDFTPSQTPSVAVIYTFSEATQSWLIQSFTLDNASGSRMNFGLSFGFR